MISGQKVQNLRSDVATLSSRLAKVTFRRSLLGGNIPHLVVNVNNALGVLQGVITIHELHIRPRRPLDEPPKLSHTSGRRTL